MYSFGVVLFEALTGRLPYDPPFGLDPPAAAADLLRQSAAGPVRPVGVPRPLTRLVERCLAADPASRPAAADIDRALSRYMRRRVRRNRMAVAGVALMVVALAGWRLTVSVRESAALAGPAAVAPHSPPTTPDELFARGLEYLRVGDIAPAMADFGAAYGDRPDGRTAAYFAYCLAKSGNNAAAAELYKEAVQKHGYDAAWVRCNRAASLLQLGSPAQIRLAGDEAAAAIQLDPNLAPARLTRAWIRYLDARRQFPSGGAGPDGQALADIGVALRLGYSNADVHYKAALIVLMFGIAKEDARAEAVRHLAEAVSLGRNPRTLIVDRFLSAQLADRSDFRDLERLTPGFAPAFIDPHLASPPD